MGVLCICWLAVTLSFWRVDMDKVKAKMIGEELMLAAEKIAAKYNLNVKRGNGKYGEDHYKINNLTFTEILEGEDNDGRFTAQEREDMKNWFDFNKYNHGLDDVEVGQVFHDDKGRNMKIIGWKTRNRKFPIMLLDEETGKYFKVTPKHLWMEMKLK